MNSGSAFTSRPRGASRAGIMARPGNPCPCKHAARARSMAGAESNFATPRGACVGTADLRSREEEEVSGPELIPIILFPYYSLRARAVGKREKRIRSEERR